MGYFNYSGYISITSGYSDNDLTSIVNGICSDIDITPIEI